MPLSRDPDTLRVPAFMRKKSLSARLKKPLVLTALDRKKTGMAGKVKRQKARPTQGRPPDRSVGKVKSETQKLKSIGTITHYYDKIRVGVIKLTGTLSVGDCITYETDEGSYEQVIESIEINREPVFKARSGKEIGLKLNKMPHVGCAVSLRGL